MRDRGDGAEGLAADRRREDARVDDAEPRRAADPEPRVDLPSAWEGYAPGDCPRFDAAKAAATCATEDARATWRRLGGAAPGAVWVAL